MTDRETSDKAIIQENQDELPIISIDLEMVNAQSELNENDLIQKHVYVALKKRIKKRLDWINNKFKFNQDNFETTQVMPSGSGWVSFIDGTRGAGKSTFLQTTLRLLAEDDHFKQLAVIGCIDPSRIESNEIVMLTLLHALKEKVESSFKPFKQCEIGRQDHECWQQAFRNVAGGLVMFQPNHHPLNELDEDLFLDLGLEQAGHSAKLRNNLSHLFAQACKLLKVDALLFAFDDADTNSKHAIALLEFIRNYLDTPRVLILLTGDLELYSLLVRQNFRSELSQGKPKEWSGENASNDRSKQQSRMLDHLEEQYLLKLFPVQERQTLFPLWRLVDKTGTQSAKAQYQVKVNGTTEPLIDFVQNRIRDGFRLTTNSDIVLYTEFFFDATASQCDSNIGTNRLR